MMIWEQLSLLDCLDEVELAALKRAHEVALTSAYEVGDISSVEHHAAQIACCVIDEELRLRARDSYGVASSNPEQ